MDHYSEGSQRPPSENDQDRPSPSIAPGQTRGTRQCHGAATFRQREFGLDPLTNCMRACSHARMTRVTRKPARVSEGKSGPADIEKEPLQVRIPSLCETAL